VPLPTYVGIAGADNLSIVAGSASTASGAGVLRPGGKVKMRDITDGTTNTLMIGEQSDWGKNGAANFDIRSATQHGGWMGTGKTGWPGSGVDWTGDNRTFNLTTVRYKIGQKLRIAGATNGMETNCGVNKPIQSVHIGGAQVLLADGSVRFASDSLNLGLLKNLVNRNDDNVIGEW
jgi:prepilin-type processing-associated H-X9-DG protein